MKRRAPPDEEHWLSLRTDADSYADDALASLSRVLFRLSERERGYIRDALREAFQDGECQGECRGLALLGLVQRRTRSPQTQRLLDMAIDFLMG